MTGHLTVESTTGLVTVQDLGRRGLAHLGVPRAGAADAGSAALAHRLVGNPPDAALLEVTLGSIRVTSSRSATVAVTGARCSVTVGERPAAFGHALSVTAGSTVIVGPPEAGARTYLAVGGGVAVEPVLGSRATDTLAWLGPARVEAGCVLPLGPRTEPHPVDHVPMPARRDSVRALPGPRDDWFTRDAQQTLWSATWRVGAASNRVGVRLDGPRLARARSGELPSEGMVLGAVQVPPSGQPVVFLHDHPVTGGYPVIAVVEEADLGIVAQLRPGESLRFRPA